MRKKLFYFTTQPYGSCQIIVSLGLTSEELVNAFNPLKHPENFSKVNNVGDIKRNLAIKNFVESNVSDSGELVGFLGYIEFMNGVKMYHIHIDMGEKYTELEFFLTVSHEVLHLCQRHLPTYFNRDKEAEAEAYFHENLTKKIIEAYNNDEENDFNF